MLLYHFVSRYGVDSFEIQPVRIDLYVHSKILLTTDIDSHFHVSSVEKSKAKKFCLL